MVVAPLLSAKASLAEEERESGEVGKETRERRDEARGDRGNGERTNELTDYITAAVGRSVESALAAVGAWKRPSSGP